MANERIRILCVDDHAIVREGIASLIERHPDMTVAGTAGSADEAVMRFLTLKPDVTLMDLGLRRSSGVDAIRNIRRHDASARIVVLTVAQGDEAVVRAFDAGATAYLLKEQLADDLVKVIRMVHAGEAPPLRPDLEEALRRRAEGETLTSREVQVLELMAQGFRNKEVAAVLGISEGTAHAHTKKIFAKLKVNDRTAAITVALRRGILRLDD